MMDFIAGDKVYFSRSDSWEVGTIINSEFYGSILVEVPKEKGTPFVNCSPFGQEKIKKYYKDNNLSLKNTSSYISVMPRNIRYRYRTNTQGLPICSLNPLNTTECKISALDFLKMFESDEVDTVKEDKLTQILQGLKGDAINAGYRVGSVQLTNAVKAAVVAVLQKQGSDGGTIAQVASFLDSDVGAAMISMTLAFALPQLPENISSNPHIEKLATELQINSMTTVGNLVMDEVSGHVMPALNAIFENLPKEEEEQEVANVSRVRLNRAPVEEEEAPVEYAPLVAEK